MTIRTTTWHPDTCDCIVEFEWDDAVAADQRVHTGKRNVRVCARHASVAGADQIGHFARLMDENPRKNKLLERLRSQFSELTETDGSGQVVLKRGVVSWSFDDSHVLHISVPSLTTQKKTLAQAWCDANLGVGKVVVE